MLLRAHPAMAPVWRLLSAALADEPGRASRRFLAQIEAEPAALAHAASWVIGRRAVILTHSSSSSVVAALRSARKRVSVVICTESNPGGEGKRLARHLAREGFAVATVPDTAMMGAAERADVVITGADAVTEDGAVNKVGTYLLALAARESGTPCYTIAGSSKLIPSSVWERVAAPLYERTPLGLFDGIIAERGTLSPAAVRRAVRRIDVPRDLTKVLR